MKTARRKMFPVYLDTAQKVNLKRLSQITRVPMAVFLRESVDDLLTKYSKNLETKETKL